MPALNPMYMRRVVVSNRIEMLAQRTLTIQAIESRKDIELLAALLRHGDCSLAKAFRDGPVQKGDVPESIWRAGANPAAGHQYAVEFACHARRVFEMLKRMIRQNDVDRAVFQRQAP